MGRRTAIPGAVALPDGQWLTERRRRSCRCWDLASVGRPAAERPRRPSVAAHQSGHGASAIQISDQQVRALRRIMVPAAPARLQLQRLRCAGWDDLLIAERVHVAAPELVELAAGADTCSLLLTIRLTATARTEDSDRCRRGAAWLPDEVTRIAG